MEGEVRCRATAFLEASRNCFCGIIPNKKDASRVSGRAVVFLFYFQTTKSQGVNPPNFELYISIRIRSLKENARSKGLDKISPESGKRVGWPFKPTPQVDAPSLPECPYH